MNDQNNSDKTVSSQPIGSAKPEGLIQKGEKIVEQAVDKGIDKTTEVADKVIDKVADAAINMSN